MKKGSFSKGGINAVLLTMYLCLIALAFVDVYITDNMIPLLLIVLILGAVFFLISCYLLDKLSKIEIPVRTINNNNDKLKFFSIAASCCFLIMMIWYVAYFPGTFIHDSEDQYNQVLIGEYNNWHPALQTLLFFTLPLKLFHGKVWGIVFFQIILFALSMAITITSVYKYLGIRPAIIVFLFVVCNPCVNQVGISPTKDVAFAITGMLSMTLVLDFYGEYIGVSKTNGIAKYMLCGLMIALTAIFRHNGILFSAVLLIALLFITDKRKWLFMTCIFIISFFLIKSPLYKAFHVDTGYSSDVMQVTGFPMTVIGNVVKETPELLDEETAEFVYSIAPQDEWDRVYELGNFFVVRYSANINPAPVEEAGVLRIVKMAARCFINSPKAAIKAGLALTDITYGWDIKDDGWFGAGTYDSSFEELNTTGIPWLANILLIYYKIIRAHGLNFTRQTSFAMLALLIVMLAKCDLSRWEGWKKAFLCLPVFAYNFGTMFFLGTSDARFFFINYLVCPVMIVMLLLEDGKGNEGVTENMSFKGVKA